MSTRTVHEREEKKLQVYWGKKREKEEAYRFGVELYFLPPPPVLAVLWVGGQRSWWHHAPWVALQHLSPPHPHQHLKKWQEVDAAKQRMSLRIQRTNNTRKSWKAWGKYLMQSIELPPTLANCISHYIVFNHYSGAMTCSNLLLQLHLGFTWQSLIKIELPRLQNKDLIKAECFQLNPAGRACYNECHFQ